MNSLVRREDNSHGVGFKMMRADVKLVKITYET
jgi:hypothetical protein